VCGESYEIQDLLLNEAIKIAEKKNAESIELRHTTNVFNSLPTKTAKVSMRLDLPQNPDELWHSFSSNLRRKIRKPTKEGFSWQYGREGELDNFYTVFSRNMRDLGTPVYSKGFFRNILQEFPDSTWIGTVKTKGGRPIASAFLVGFRDRLEIPWVSSLRSYNRHYANLFLYWNMLKFASESGYKVFDFGRSTLGEGTYKFKEQWGAKPVQLYWHYWAKNGRPLQQLNPKNPKYRLAIYIWKKLPVSLTKLIGPEIRKYIWL
jgi:FemAB-related protein (PEP-CTERM system-associated)